MKTIYAFNVETPTGGYYTSVEATCRQTAETKVREKYPDAKQMSPLGATIENTEPQVKRTRWYFIPAYTDRFAENKVVNAAGELVATFEDRDEAEYIVDLHNHTHGFTKI